MTLTLYSDLPINVTVVMLMGDNNTYTIEYPLDGQEPSLAVIVGRTVSHIVRFQIIHSGVTYDWPIEEGEDGNLKDIHIHPGPDVWSQALRAKALAVKE